MALLCLKESNLTFEVELGSNPNSRMVVGPIFAIAVRPIQPPASVQSSTGGVYVGDLILTSDTAKTNYIVGGNHYLTSQFCGI